MATGTATDREWLLPLTAHPPGQPQKARCRLFVREMGSGPRVVLLHGGWGGDHRSLLGLRSLADAHRLVFYDQRGSWASPCEVPPTVDDHLDDLDRVREALGDEELVLVGHSMGGWLAQAYAARWPERVGGLVLLSPAPARSALLGSREEDRGARPEVVRELRRHGLGDDASADSPQEASLRSRILFGARNLHDVTRWSEIALPWFGSRDADASAMTSMPDDYDFTEALTALGRPILVVAGDDDFLPLESQREWTDAVPNAALVVVEGAGHLPWIDRPDGVLTAVRRYLTGRGGLDRG